jgi:hypothetical protein
LPTPGTDDTSPSPAKKRRGKVQFSDSASDTQTAGVSAKLLTRG